MAVALVALKAEWKEFPKAGMTVVPMDVRWADESANTMAARRADT